MTKIAERNMSDGESSPLHELTNPFLPDPVRAEIVRMLAALPRDTEPLAVAAHVRAAIPFGVEIDEQLPHRIAEAFPAASPTRRIGSFTESQIAQFTQQWATFPWRLFPETRLSAAENVALDEVLCESGQPSLRFWNWSESAVILGRCQSVSNEVHSTASLTIMRRLSGGGAMFVQPGGTITYSLIVPEEVLTGLSLRQSYEVCDAWVIAGLRQLGVDVHHVPINDLACWRGKIGGAAQSRRRGVVLHHTTIAYRLDNAEMAKVLRVGQPKKSNRSIGSAAKVVSPLCDQVTLSREEIVRHLFEQFRTRYNGDLSSLSVNEVMRMQELVHEKYAHPDWLNEFP